MRKLLFLLLVLYASSCPCFSQDQQLIDSLKTVAKTTKEDTIKIKAFNYLSYLYWHNDTDSALSYANQALKLAEQVGFKKEVWGACNNLGAVTAMKGNFTQSRLYYERALTIAIGIGSKRLTGISYNNIGLAFSTEGDYPNALKNYLLALKILEEIGDKHICPYSYTNIGIIYNTQGDFDKALKHYLISLKLSNETGDKTISAETYSHIGNNFASQNNFSEALKNNFISLKISREIKDKQGIARANVGIGEVYSKTNNFPEAIKYFSESLKIWSETGEKEALASTYLSIGDLYLKEKKYKEAFNNLDTGLLISKKIGSLINIKKSYEYLSILNNVQGNYKQALEHYKKSIVTKDSLFSQTKTKEITRNEMIYEQEKKDVITKAEQERKNSISKSEIERQKLIRNFIAGAAGIIILFSLFTFFFYKHKRDAIQKQKETVLSLQVSETEMKALRSQMNPHFIFNALQSIQTFLLSHKPNEANTYLLKFSKLMRLVLENSQYSEVSLKEDMQALELYMQLESIRLPHPFTYKFHIDKAINEEEATIPPLILQPFVENAIWHGLQYKPESGQIDIFISKRDNSLYAVVQDNGVGRDMTKKNTRPLLMKRESLGMKLTEERLKILNELKHTNAQFKIIDLFTKDNQPSGTKVELSLPLAG